MNHTHGNHIEIQALSELYNRPIEVYQYGTGMYDVVSRAPLQVVGVLIDNMASAPNIDLQCLGALQSYKYCKNPKQNLDIAHPTHPLTPI